MPCWDRRPAYVECGALRRFLIRVTNPGSRTVSWVRHRVGKLAERVPRPCQAVGRWSPAGGIVAAPWSRRTVWSCRHKMCATVLMAAGRPLRRPHCRMLPPPTAACKVSTRGRGRVRTRRATAVEHHVPEAGIRPDQEPLRVAQSLPGNRDLPAAAGEMAREVERPPAGRGSREPPAIPPARPSWRPAAGAGGMDRWRADRALPPQEDGVAVALRVQGHQVGGGSRPAGSRCRRSRPPSAPRLRAQSEGRPPTVSTGGGFRRQPDFRQPSEQLVLPDEAVRKRRMTAVWLR